MGLVAAHAALLRSLISQLQGDRPANRITGVVPVEHYTSPDHFERETHGVFRRVPQVVALERDLDEPGAQIAVEIAGISLLVVRGHDGVVRAFKNACRHRATRLVHPGPARTAKAIVCPYHGWTYDLSGCRLHAPHAESFCGMDGEREALIPVHAGTYGGFVFAGLTPFELDRYLAPVAPDLAALGASGWYLYRRTEREVAGNWKLIIDAFLDGYHIRHLHRDTVYRFFLDGCFDAEEAGPHIRSLVGRRALREVHPQQIGDLRSVATPSYLLFPNTVLILHPDYLSVTVAAPLAVGRTRFLHAMLTPTAPRSQEEDSHWQKSFELIDGGVFGSEDLGAVEAMQRGMETGADRTLLFGQHEFPALWFHRSLARQVASASQRPDVTSRGCVGGA